MSLAETTRFGSEQHGTAQKLANRLWDAERHGQLVDLPVLDTTRQDEARGNEAAAPARDVSIELAYQAQTAGRTLRLSAGDQLAGYKVGVTSVDAQKALGAGGPVHGYLLGNGLLDDGATIDSAPLHAPRIEVEIAFVLGSPVAGGDVGEAEILAATDHCRIALEIVDTRWAQRPPLGLLIADNVSAARVVLGPRIDPDAIGWESIAVTLAIGDRTARGGSDGLGHPAAYVAWLTRALHDQGERLEAGQIVMSGTLLPPVPARPGDHVTADFAGLGRVTAAFTVDAPRGQALTLW